MTVVRMGMTHAVCALIGCSVVILGGCSQAGGNAGSSSSASPVASTEATTTVFPTRDGSWSWQVPKPQGVLLGAVDFANDRAGLAVGDCGTVLRTADAGQHWESVREEAYDERLTGVSFPSKRAAWIIGLHEDTGRLILERSLDGGLSWRAQRLGFAHVRLDAISCGPRGGWAIGSDTRSRAPLLARSVGGKWRLGETGVRRGRFLATATNDGVVGWIVGKVPDGKGRKVPLILRTDDGGATWIRQSAGFTRGEVTSVAMTDGAHGWAVGHDARRPYSPVLMRTTDGGSTWIGESRNDGDWGFVLDVRALTFPDSSHGWGLCDYQDLEGQLACTSDGGRTWRIIADPVLQTEVALTSCAFPTASRGWIVGGHGLIARTVDGGKTVRLQAGLHTYSWSSMSDRVCAVDRSRAWAIVGGRLLRTANGGRRWVAVPGDPGADFSYLAEMTFSDAENGWIATVFTGVEKPGVLHTSDGGRSWARQRLPLSWETEVTSIRFANALVGWVTWESWDESAVSGLLKSSDGGATWDPVSVGGPADRLEAVCFVDSAHAWAVVDRYGEAILSESRDGGKSWVRVNAAGLPSTAHVSGIVMDGNAHGWISGSDESSGSAVLLRSTDGGRTWTRASVPLSATWIGTPAFADPAQGWAAGSMAEGARSEDVLLATRDGGANWSVALERATAPAFVDAEHGWAVSSLGGILATSDGGWAAEPDRPPAGSD